MSLLVPDKLFARISDIDIAQDLCDVGIQAVLLDVDNTIRPLQGKDVPFDILRWIRKVQAADIAVCLLSNNFHHNVLALGASIGVPVVGKALKPLPVGFWRAAKRLSVAPASMVMVGDQLFTDILGAHLVGMKAYMVGPLVRNDLPHTALLRQMEAVILKDTQPQPTSLEPTQACCKSPSKDLIE